MGNFDIEQGFTTSLSREEVGDIYAALKTTANHMRSPIISLRLRELADRINNQYLEEIKLRIEGSFKGESGDAGN